MTVEERMFVLIKINIKKMSNKIKIHKKWLILISLRTKKYLF